MFFYFDYSKLKTKSIVYVDLIGNLNDRLEFQSFTNQWLDLYKLKTDFIFIFNTDKVEFVHPKFCLYMALFIYRLKQQANHYLKMSIFIIKNEYIKQLLYYIFYLQSPISDIYITSDISNINNILDNKLNDEIIHITP